MSGLPDDIKPLFHNYHPKMIGVERDAERSLAGMPSRIPSFDQFGFPAKPLRLREAEYLVQRGWARWATYEEIAEQLNETARTAQAEVSAAIRHYAAEIRRRAASGEKVILRHNYWQSPKMLRRHLIRAALEARVTNGGQPALTVAFDLDGTLITEPPDEFGAVPGAIETLQWCRAQGWRIALWTINHRTVAMTRLLAAGIPLDLFDAIVAVRHKDPKTLRRRLSPLARGAKLAVVGNSWRHDVAPALGIADAVVWVQGRRKPGVEGTPEDLARFPVAVVPSVAQVPEVLPDVLRCGYDKAVWRGYGVSQFPCLSGLPDPGCFASWRRWRVGPHSNRHFDFLAR